MLFRHPVLLLILVLIWSAGATATPVAAQSYFAGIAVHAGTLGLGADFGLRVNQLIGLRAGVNFLPSGIDFPIEDVDYDADLPSPQYTALLDFHPGGSLFRLSAGTLYSPEHLKAKARPEESVRINGDTYEAEDVGTLFGEVRNRDFAPYVGIGYGKTGGSNFGFFIDIGAAFHGSPELHVEADGPIADVPSFQADLEADRQQFEDKASWARVYPVLSIGFTFGVL